MKELAIRVAAALGLLVSVTVAGSESRADAPRLCVATAREAPGETARALARGALVEHAAWRGHRIDAAGRLTRFGSVESEVADDPEDGRRLPLGAHGWWNTWRYWSELDAQKLVSRDILAASAIANAREGRDPGRPEARRDLRIGEIIARLPLGAGTPMRDAVEQSLIRAALADVPWSAVFISYLVHRATGLRDHERFRFDAAHRAYLEQAFETSELEASHGSPRALYRACPVETTRPRPGDLLCYQREEPCRGARPAHLRALMASGTPVPDRPACTAIRRTHCDVVVGVDPAARKVEAIGGNVLHGVALRRMNLTRAGALSPNQGGGDCGENAETGRDCSLNQRDWFVLLQLR